MTDATYNPNVHRAVAPPSVLDRPRTKPPERQPDVHQLPTPEAPKQPRGPRTSLKMKIGAAVVSALALAGGAFGVSRNSGETTVDAGTTRTTVEGSVTTSPNSVSTNIPQPEVTVTTVENSPSQLIVNRLYAENLHGESATRNFIAERYLDYAANNPVLFLPNVVIADTEASSGFMVNPTVMLVTRLEQNQVEVSMSFSGDRDLQPNEQLVFVAPRAEGGIDVLPFTEYRRFYQVGNSDQLAAQNSTGISSDGSFQMGEHEQISYYFPGSMDRVAAMDTALAQHGIDTLDKELTPVDIYEAITKSQTPAQS